ncbi:MAG: 4-hydroxybutyrate dehydrogenase [Sedimentibacter sp.]|uniref:4-hydroxybutyrate dehydrogenase n=1 Tax=Sedimentibacter sp. TaxID=1960295 RepID=UPI0031587E65
MKQLLIKPEIHKSNTFDEFYNEFNVGEKDLILTIDPIFSTYLKDRKEKFNVVFPEHYALGEPTDEMIDKILADTRKIDYDRVIAIGGGSILDIAKLFALRQAERSEQLYLREVPIIKEKKLVIIPTTCGTGSEVTNISIALVTKKNTKMGLAGDELSADFTVLIPELLLKLPYKVFVTSSVDALIHAAESFLSPKTCSYTELFSVKAMEIILKGYMEVIEKGQEHFRTIIEDFLVASNYAGIAFGNTGVGAVHAMSYPLGGVYHVPHGEANYQFFIEVFKYYEKKQPNGKIQEIKKLIANVIGTTENEAFEDLGQLLNNLLALKPLKEYGMKHEEIESFAKNVLETQQRLLKNNYVPFSEHDLINIYSKLY